ncbi:hypothetical protein CI109_104631 [Kwoniella shandongensis]|uniref:Uncharacterized protein n=1 Tax=Kwoniella shandongensis TaxID=1734106 RepID=A0A5M6BVA9_9TREE|nr:uncharacterized protein CI109_004797 [Kwoniella shandongensis]KAA5526797.1 hypothetical protein CI109_004797 [Kwoniella shandongensis]
MEATTPQPHRRPGGARPNPKRPSSSGSGSGSSFGAPSQQPPPPPPKLCIPSGNVPGMNVDQNNEGGWQIPSVSLPALALRPMKPISTPSSSTRPKLTLSAVPSPSASPSLPPATTLPITRPPLLNAPSSSLYAPKSASRSATPALKLSIPGLIGSGTSSGFSATGHDYPTESEDNDDLASALKTPTPLRGGGMVAEDMNPTLQARGNDYDGDGESSYGYGQVGNGLRAGGGGSSDQISAMTEDIRQALSRSKYESSPASSLSGLPGNRSRSGSNATRSRAGSSATNSRRGSGGSNAIPDDLLSFRSLEISSPLPASDAGWRDTGSGRGSMEERRSAGTGAVASGSSDGHGHGWNDDGEEKRSPVFNPDDLVLIRRLGEGTGGSVDMVQDRRTGKIMAKKVIARTANPSMHKQLLRELQFLDSCDSPYIVEHYGSFLAEHESIVGIVMEYCEAGSLDSLLQNMKRKGMRCSEHVLGRIASSVLKGLDYLHERRIIHRDIKPSNIVVTRQGAVKLCDFGVSGELIESLAGTFTGTSFYMAPERIQNKPYSIKADVWSLGMTLHEIAHLRFPFPPEGENQSVAPIELLSYIVTAPVPVMMDDPTVGRVWSEQIKGFMAACLIRSGTERPYPWQLLRHPFIITTETKKINMAKWVAALCDWPPP